MNKTKATGFSVTRIIRGFEFGHGAISGLAAKHQVLAAVDQAIQHDPGLLVPISLGDDGQPLSDDGCGDGRPVLTVFSLDHEYRRSLNRPKVFGGAATMAAASAIGLGDAGQAPLNDVFEAVITDLDRRGIDFGAHTDESMHGDNCGCGAIDKAPQILFAALKYEIPIRGAVTLLSDDVVGLNEVYANFRRYVSRLADHPNYSGRQVLETILHNDRTRVVKQLGGAHKECRIVLNTVRGYTINQQLIRDVSGGEAQVFGVDVWRMQDIAQNLYPNQPNRQHKAFLSELIYTVATAAVLTKGDLPVDVVTAQG